MSIAIAMSNTQISSLLIDNIEILVNISLIISIFMALLISDSNYWNKWASSTLDASTVPLLITFALIYLFKITLII
jgi:hypothetical protein